MNLHTAIVVDWPRAIVIAWLAYVSGTTVAAGVRAAVRLYRDATRVWAARLQLRISTLVLVFFVVDCMADNWTHPPKVRLALLLAGTLFTPWAENVISAEFDLRARRASDLHGGRRTSDPPDSVPRDG